MNRWAYPVALAAALALTAQAEWTLALAVGWWMYVAWCWPAAVDVYVIASFRAGRDRAWAIALMGLSVSAAHSLPVLWPGGLPWWVRGLMSVVPVLVAWRVHEMRPVRQLQADLGATLADRTEQDDLLDRYRALGPLGRAAYARAAEGGPGVEVETAPGPQWTDPGPDPRTADRPVLHAVPQTPGRSVPSGGPVRAEPRATPDQVRSARAACAGLARPVSGRALKDAVRRAGGTVRNDPDLIKELVRAVNHDPDEEESANAAV